MLLSRLVATSAIIGATLVSAAHNITVYVNDTSVSYTGLSWAPYTNCGGTKYTYSTGQFFTVRFVGVAVYLVGTASEEGGMIGLNLDGVEQTPFDRYAVPPYRCGVPWFSKSGLQNGTHTLTATLTGNSPENSTTAGFIEWQWLEYTQLDASDLLTTSSASSASSTSTIATTTSAAAATTSGKTSSNGAAIGAGVAGGIIAVAVIAFLLWWFCIRKNSNTGNTTRPDLGGEGGFSPASGPHSNAFNPPAVPPMRQQDYRSSMSMRNGAVPGATAWTPDALSAASLSPQNEQQYPHGAAPPMGFSSYGSPNMSASAQQPLLSNYTGSGGPAGSVSAAGSNTTSSGLYTTNPTEPYPANLNPASRSHNQSVGPGSAVSGSASQLPESDVDRIAARVASMMNQGQNPPPPVPSATATDYDMPPPMYNEKH